MEQDLRDGERLNFLNIFGVDTNILYAMKNLRRTTNKTMTKTN